MGQWSVRKEWMTTPPMDDEHLDESYAARLLERQDALQAEADRLV
jgi:hypothetical protein